MKLLTTLAFTTLFLTAFSQKSEALVPKDAISVFSINNVNVLQKISMDDLVKYQFMEEVHQELFDGSTSGRTLKDSGVDFDQRINFFQGNGNHFSVSGFTLGMLDREQFFQVFDDYTPAESNYAGVDFYESYFNRIAIRGNSAIIFRVEPNMYDIEEMTDSIWYARGNEYKWYDEWDYWDEDEEKGSAVETVEEEGYDEFEEYESEENTNNPIEEDVEMIAEENPYEKTYWELRDSVELVFQTDCIKRLCDELFVDNESLMTEDSRFAKQMTHTSDAVFFVDNSRNIEQESNMDYMRMIYPHFARNIDELYKESLILGDLNIRENSVEMDMKVGYSEELGKIYTEMTNTRFDKTVLKYIPEDNGGFFTYTVNMRKAYETTYAYLLPMLSESEGPISLAAITLELIDEFANKDAIFDLYQGNVFGTYNGVKTIKTKKIIFEYDEENFEYSEREVEAEEEMPVFTFGFSTKRNDIPERILKRVARVYPELQNKGDYWVFEDGVLNTAPLFFILQNDLFIVTNDDDLARNHAKGYGALALNKKTAKEAKKSGMMYAKINTDRAIQDLPATMFNDYENELLDVLRGKSGDIVMTSSKSTKTSTDFKLSYNFNGAGTDPGTYILDLINSLYIISK
ncbi:MAG: hypothetical protein HRT58_11135 [Crocinitomicaceae bacterium]|nr:hypothetical protein [Flavobacteriales bacterium]NQZ36210.1 hypothetical protein [Crocinitomicaceae bacterium]